MNNITKTLTIDLYSPSSYEVVKAQQGDSKSRTLEFVLNNQGAPYHIPDNVEIYLEGHRGDRSPFPPKPCTVSDNRIWAILDGDILYAPGTAEAKIVLYDSAADAVLSTIPFSISIQKSPCDKNKIASEKHSVIDWLILNFRKLKDKLSSTEQAVAEETRRATAAEEAIAENLSQESERAVSKESEITQNLSKEIERASNAEKELTENKADLDSPSLTGEPTAPTAPSNTNTAQIATTAFVKTAVSEGIAASDAMIFKGTIGMDGTITELPSTYKTGWTYRVTTEGVYAGETCENGDLIIALVDRDGSENLDSDWCVAQTNIDGAITEIKGLDGHILCARSGSSVTVRHGNVERTETSSSQTIADKDSFSAIKSISINDQGHVTAIETQDVTLNLSSLGVVTGVKGDSETEYRGGNVNLTAEDVGALPISGGTMTGRIQIPSKALSWNEGKELSNAAIGIIRPYSPNAYFSVIADKTVSNYIWSLGSIQDEVGIYGYTKDGATPHWKFAIDATTGNITTGGRINANGQILCHGSYTSEAINRFGASAIQVRENNLVKNTQSDIGYAPSIGFHWAERAAGTLCLGVDSKLRFLYQAGNTGTIIANLEGNASTATTATKATQDGSGNVITSTYAKKSIYGDTSVSLGRKIGTTVGENSFAVGYNVEASGGRSHAEGGSTTASGSCSHAEGVSTIASNDYSHAEGGSTTASGSYSHAEGNSTTASGSYSHAEGYHTTANGFYSHAEGYYTTASGSRSHAEGYYTKADNNASYACGKYNKSMVNGGSSFDQIGDAFVIGNGTGNTSRSNALRVTYKGDILGTKAFQSSGADYAEFIKPWADGNPDNEDRVGYFVTIKDGYLHKANEGAYITGITSGNPSVVGNADEDYYWRYERDNFNRIVMEDVPETVQATDDEENPLFDEETHEPIMVETGNIIPNARMKLAKDYDPSLQESYVERKDRKEWDYVGMLGVLPVRDDGSCIPGQFCKSKNGGIATLADEKNFNTYMVIERIAENIVAVILK